jgi:5-methyltetrahydropteroyltriglutamate--homocysteine methyltransferase
MRRSDDHILVTHVGSLPRRPDVLDALLRRNGAGQEIDDGEFRSILAPALDEIVDRQQAAGVDVGSDGELPRVGFNIYVKDRIAGFGGRTVREQFSDFKRFPGYRDLRTGAQSTDKAQAALALRAAAPAAVGKMVYDETLQSARRSSISSMVRSNGRARGLPKRS